MSQRVLLASGIAVFLTGCDTSPPGEMTTRIPQAGIPGGHSQVAISDVTLIKKYPSAQHYVVVLGLTLTGDDLSSRTLEANALITPSGESPATTTRPIPLSAPQSPYFIERQAGLGIAPRSPQSLTTTVKANFPYPALKYASADVDLTLSLTGPGRVSSHIRVFIPPTPPPDFDRR